MAVSSTQATAMLGALPSPLYIQAHTGDPGAAGTANTIGTRGTVNLNAASGGQRTASGNSDCPGITLGASVTHVSYWDAVSGGTFRFSQPLEVSVSFTYAGTLRFTSQTFTIGSATAGSQTSTSVNTDTGSSAESNTIRLGVNVSDTGSGSDTTWASQGPLSVTSDTGSSTDSIVVALTVVVADTGSSSDSNTPTEIDGVAPSVGTLTVPDTSGTSITGISASATDAVGVTGWVIVEQAADSGWSAPAASACSNTAGISGGSLSSSSLTFTSSATETGTRYFRIYCRDAAGNVGASATDSATITIAASGITYVGAGTETNTNIGVLASFSAPLPAGVAENDLIFVVLCGGQYCGWTDPAGYTSLGIISAHGTWYGGGAYYKRAGASESDPSFTNQANDGEGDTTCQYIRRTFVFRGAAASGSPLDTAAARTTATSATITGSTRTTATNNAMMIMLGLALGAPVSTPGGSVDAVVTGTLFIAYDDAPSNTAGAQSAPTAAQTSAAYDVYTVAVKPA